MNLYFLLHGKYTNKTLHRQTFINAKTAFQTKKKGINGKSRIFAHSIHYSTSMQASIQRELNSWLGILLGSFILALGFVIFINPYNIVPGGVYGASIVLHNIFPHIQVGWFGYCFDVPLLILSLLLLGGKLGAKTLVASLITPMLMNTLDWVVYPSAEAMRALDPSQLLGGYLDLSQHLILAVLFGSLLIGIGSGIVIKSGATTGGSDIVSMLMQKYLHIRFSRAILMVDGCVVLFGLIVFSLHAGSEAPAVGSATQQSQGLLLSLYSLISIYLISQTLARTINGSKDDKLLFIISDKNLQKLHEYILVQLDRTATLINSSGLYTHKDKEMIFIVVSYKEVQKLKQQVKEADPDAFVIVTDAYDTYGAGWKALPNKGEVQPE